MAIPIPVSIPVSTPSPKVRASACSMTEREKAVRSDSRKLTMKRGLAFPYEIAYYYGLL